MSPQPFIDMILWNEMGTISEQQLQYILARFPYSFELLQVAWHVLESQEKVTILRGPVAKRNIIGYILTHRRALPISDDIILQAFKTALKGIHGEVYKKALWVELYFLHGIGEKRRDDVRPILRRILSETRTLSNAPFMRIIKYLSNPAFLDLELRGIAFDLLRYPSDQSVALLSPVDLLGPRSRLLVRFILTNPEVARQPAYSAVLLSLTQEEVVQAIRTFPKLTDEQLLTLLEFFPNSRHIIELAYQKVARHSYSRIPGGAPGRPVSLYRYLQGKRLDLGRVRNPASIDLDARLTRILRYWEESTGVLKSSFKYLARTHP